MKRIMLLVFLLVVLSNAHAECGFYTYQDVWIDDSGSAISDNYTQADCEDSTAYSEGHIRMPSGAEVAASASGSVSAEAITESSSSNEQGEGDFWGFNEVSSVCWEATTSSFELPIDIDLAYTKSKWNNTYTTLPGGAVKCFVSTWCTPATTPPTCDVASADQYPLIVGQQASCKQYYDTSWLTVRIKRAGVWGPRGCAPLIPGQNAIGTDDSSVKSCTKLPE
jgi:hypothetical protein